jgi:hypothetical protein
MRSAGLAGVGIILGTLSSPATKPAVTLVEASPVVIAGSGYTAGAKFFVTYRSGGTQIRRHVVATLAGRYRVVLRGVSFTRCDGLRITAPDAGLRVPSCAAGGAPTVTARRGGLVSGSSFVPGERVALSARVADLVVRGSVRAGRSGAFSDRLSLPRAACTEIDVHAVGSFGSTATFVLAAAACRKP